MTKPLAIFLPLTLLAACGNDPPTPTQVRSHITSDLGNVIGQTNAASHGAQLPGTGSLDLLTSALPSIGGSGAASAVTKLMARIPHAKVTGKSRLAADTADVQVDADAAIKYLNDNLFTDANYQGNGIYTVPASLVCSSDTVDANGNTTSAIDPDCASKLAQAQLRIRVEENDSTLTFAIQLDANHDEPLAISLSHTSIGFTIDLDDADAAIAALATVFSETPPNVSLSGQVTARLDILGDAHAKASLTIDRALDIAGADQGQPLDGPDAVRVTSAKADVLSIELDGNAQTGQIDLGLGATTVQAPDSGDVIAIDLPGASASASIAGGGPLSIQHISLGDRTTTVKKNGTQAVAIDLNKDDGRSLSAAIAQDGTLSVSPKLDLRMAVDHAVLGDTAGPYDVTQVLLDGSVRGTDAGEVQIVSGTFQLVTNPASYGMTASAGQCVSQTEVQDTVTGDYYEQWLAGTCN